MGTTAVACLIPDPRVAHVAYVAHVGDSRAYLSRAGDLRALTRDHSAVQGLIDRGFLTEGGAKDHPMRNMLFKSLGRPNIRAETHAQVLHDGDRLLLCSDGLHGYATHEAIRQVMSQLIPVAHVVVGLIDLALRGGGGDNVSVVVIERGPSGSRRASP
jgi:protein phosphatase